MKDLAYFGMSMGRWYVSVKGIVLAMETDPCRDPRFPDNKWDEHNLKRLTELLNEPVQETLDLS